MSQDPFREREAEKYANPTPSREFILEHLAKREKPANRDGLAVEPYIEDEKQFEDLCRRLRVTERDGRLVFIRRQCYVLSERLNLVEGTVTDHRDDYDFLRVKGRRDDLYLSSGQMKACIHGDQVLTQPLSTDRKGRHEAHIVRALVPKTSQIIGRYFTEAGVGFVTLDDSRLSLGILVPSDQVMSARVGFVMVAELTQCPTRRTRAMGKIVEAPGDNMGTGMAADVALRTHEILCAWPQVVKRQVAGLRGEMPGEAKVGRVDLRDLPLVTIDGEDARDFDDAVYRERKRGGGWRLWVAIADVNYYVRPPTPLDRETRSRGTSVCFPSQVIPTLPEIFSNSLCSFNPRVDHPCMVCKMTVLSKGRLTDYKFYEVVMSSHVRLTYTRVWHILQGDQDLREQYAPLVKHLEKLHNLYRVLGKAREERGGISFESEEARFIFSAEHRIKCIEQTQRNDAHKLIEECMILANISAVRFVKKAKEPVLFRIHDKPSTEAITPFRPVLMELGLELPDGNKSGPHDYAELLKSVADRPNAEMLQTILLRSMKQAIYDLENRGHFGLALQSYAHFISPIRRCPDLTLHCAIRCLLAKKQGRQGNAIETSNYHCSMEEMS